MRRIVLNLLAGIFLVFILSGCEQAGSGNVIVPGNSGVITAQPVGSDSVTLNWTKAEGGDGLLYQIYFSTDNFASDVSSTETIGSPFNTAIADIETLDITGLSAETHYCFNIIVEDNLGNQAAYESLQVSTIAVVPDPPAPSPAEMDVKQNSVSIADGTSDFSVGSATINTQTDITFTISNSGDSDLNLTGTPKVSVAGSAFSLKTDAASPVISETSFVITFSPAIAGDAAGSISISSDDSDENPYIFTIVGTGLAEADPPAADGAVVITEISDSSVWTTEYVEIYNGTAGSVDLSTWTLEEDRGDSASPTTHSDIALSGVLEADSFLIVTRDATKSALESTFAVTFGADVSVISNSTMIINKTLQRFILKDGGTVIDNQELGFITNKSKVAVRSDFDSFNDSAFIMTDQSNATPGGLTSSQAATLGSGKIFTPPVATPAEMDVKQNSVSIADGTSGFSVGSVTINTQKDINFTISNSGNTDLNLTGSPKVSLTGAAFTLKTDAASPVSTETGFVITFAPTSTADFSGSISISSDDADENPYNFTIVGTGVAESALEPYYTSAAGLTGAALKAELNDIIDGHTTISYGDLWTALLDTDEDPDNPDNFVLLYTGRSIAKTEVYPEWNREHVWAKSHGDFGTSNGPGTDLHHLKPADVSVNSSRSNLDFDNGGSAHSEATACNYDSDSWEPRDEVKGDIARMMFYMDVRYDGTEYPYGDLVLVDTVSSNAAAGEHGKLSVLKQWHLDDPVDDFERNRNEAIYTDWQGNRNPFIDHPEWVEEIW